MNYHELEQSSDSKISTRSEPLGGEDANRQEQEREQEHDEEHRRTLEHLTTDLGDKVF